MDNKQIAHDLAVAYTVGKQVPVETLVVEYRKNYELIYSYLKSEQVPKVKVSSKSSLGF